MRSVARLKMGYYPLPESEGIKLRSLLTFSEPASVIDPCVGQGTALHLVTSDAPVRRYGVELDAERARIASSKGIETIQGNAFDTIARPESFSLLYLNPPYDSEIGSVANNRMERLFLEHTYRWLAIDGVLVLVIPFERLHDCAGVLSSHFARLNVLRMTDEESVQYRQIAVLGVRRNVRGVAVEENKRRLQSISPYGSFHALPELQPEGLCSLSSSAFRCGRIELSRASIRSVGRLVATVRRVEAGYALPHAARGCCDRSSHYAVTWRPCRPLVYGGPVEWRFWPGR